jgi:hypothetical protein
MNKISNLHFKIKCISFNFDKNIYKNHEAVFFTFNVSNPHITKL